jgi:hypothetical protein
MLDCVKKIGAKILMKKKLIELHNPCGEIWYLQDNRGQWNEKGKWFRIYNMSTLFMETIRKINEGEMNG